MNILFDHALLLSMTAVADEPRVIEGSLGVVGQRIALVSSSDAERAAFLAKYPDAYIYDCRGKLVMPGLINTHCHVAMSLQRSCADDIALISWLNDYIWPFEAHQTADDVACGMALGVVELLLGGVTSVVDMYFHEDRCVETVRRLGIRALLGCSYFDHTVDETLEVAERALQASADCDRVRIAIAPHAGYSCSPEAIVRGKEFARRHNLLFMSHIAETKDEERMLAERYGKRPVQLFDDLGVLDEQTIAAHCVHVNDEDIEILKRRGVVVSHNPQSNMKISSGVAPIERMRRAGVCVTVATDGPCSNNDLDLFDELRTATFLQKSSTGDPTALPAYEALRMVTANGARAMGYADGELGVLREGALADVIVIDLQKPHLQPLNDVVSHMVYCVKSSDVETVVVDGQIVVDHREVRGVDLPTLYAQASQIVRRIQSEMKKQ